MRRLWDIGLPAAIPAEYRRKQLLQRCSPLWSGIAVLVFGRAYMLRSFSLDELRAFLEAPDDGLVVDDIIMMVLLVMFLAVVVPIVVWLIMKSVMRLLPEQVGVGLGALILLLTVFSPALAMLATTGQRGSDNYSDYVSVVPVVFVAIVVYLGWTRLIVWTLKRTMQEAVTSLGRSIQTLPLLLVAFLFFFYNAELWQLGHAWSVQRSLAVAGCLWGLTVLASLVVVHEYVREMFDSKHSISIHLRLNLRYVAASVQAAQASLFGLLVFFGFVGLGMVSVPAATIEQWTNTAPAMIEFGSLAVPGILVKVSWVLGAFASLYFVTATAGDAAEREVQLGPITAEVRETLQDAGIVERPTAS